MAPQLWYQMPEDYLWHSWNFNPVRIFIELCYFFWLRHLNSGRRSRFRFSNSVRSYRFRLSNSAKTFRFWFLNSSRNLEVPALIPVLAPKLYCRSYRFWFLVLANVICSGSPILLEVMVLALQFCQYFMAPVP